MHLKLINNNILRVPSQPLHITDKREIRARAINRIDRRPTIESPNVGYQFCGNCANPIPLSELEFCLPCARVKFTERYNADFHAENKQNLKVLGLAFMFGAILIAFMSAVFQATR